MGEISRAGACSVMPNISNGRPRVTSSRQLIGFLGLLALLSSASVLGLTALTSPAQGQGSSIRFDPISTGLDRPVDIQSAGDDRLFIVEKTGRVKVLDRGLNGAAQPTVYMDLSDRVTTTGEMGLLGLTFDPGFLENKFVYVNYTLGSPRRTRVSRFTEVAGQADPSSEVVVLEFGQPQANHNGGQLAFGPDGNLYVAIGDGGGAGDPDNHAQNPASILGSIVRIDVGMADRPGDSVDTTCTTGPAGTYSIPPDNPYAGTDGACPEIWATGLRNPWRFSFDPANDDFWVSDVGQDSREELNRLAFDEASGANYGWRCYEGTIAYDTTGCGPQSDYVEPVFDYDQSGGRCSITGGVVYRGAAFPGLDGAYLFGDFCSDSYWAARVTGGEVIVDQLSIDGALAQAPSAFGTDSDGEIYVASIGGTVYKISDTSAPPAAAVTTAYSCLGNNGRIDITVTNPHNVDTDYTISVGSIPDRLTQVSANSSKSITVTGRPDGPISITVSAANTVVFEETGLIECDPEVDIRSSCLADNGRLDVVLTNRAPVSRQYAVTAGALVPRLRQVGPSESATVTVTGRSDGEIAVTVTRTGSVIAERVVTVACDPTPTGPVTITSSCLLSNGRIDIDIVNDKTTPETYTALVGNLIRERTVAPGALERITVTGRPDGPLNIVVRSAAGDLERRAVVVTCDGATG